MRTARAYLVCAIVFLVLDAIWLTLATPRLYRPLIGYLMREDFDLMPAVAFYLLYVAGMLVFVVFATTSARAAAWRGAFFGLVTYATYDLTNQATVRGWPWTVTLVDLVWGAFATATACAVTMALTARWRA